MEFIYMNQINNSFTQKVTKNLHYQLLRHKHPRVRQRMFVVYLKSLRLPNNQIEKITILTGNTVRSYINAFQKGGIEKLKKINFYQPESELAKYKKNWNGFFVKTRQAL